MDADQVLAYRYARTGLAERGAASIPAAAAGPISDFARDAALHAVAARREPVTRAAYDAAVDDGTLVVAHSIRGAIHALAPGDVARFGRALVARDETELGQQLGRQVQALAASTDTPPSELLATVTAATRAALARGARLDRTALHEALRAALDDALLPWCAGCRSHHAPPMLWRYATIVAGARLDSERRYLLDTPGRAKAVDAVRAFLHLNAPATVAQFAQWAGIAKPHAARIWGEVEDALEEVHLRRTPTFVLRADAAELGSPPRASGIRLLPPGDPWLQPINRPLLAPDAALRSRLFRPASSPGVVCNDGRLVGTWRVKARGAKAEVTVEAIGRFRRADVEAEAERIAALRGAELVMVWA